MLTATRPGLSPALCSINVEPQMKPVDFSLEKGNTLRVRVVDKDGKPIHGIFVTPDTCAADAFCVMSGSRAEPTPRGVGLGLGLPRMPCKRPSV